MKLVVTGAGGGLGRAFLDVVADHHDVTAFTREQLDITDHDAVMQAVPAAAPDAVLNLAAFTAVDRCESEPERAFAANALGVQNLAAAARGMGAVLLHVSTDYVFGGDKGAAYDETDHPDPRSVYARSKLAGERFARDGLVEHIIVRTGFVYGGGSDFLSGAVSRIAAGEEAGALADRIGTPTYVRDLARRLLPLVLARRFGTYHVAGPEQTTWFEVLTRIKAMTGFEGTVAAQTAAELALPAPRPANSSLVSVFLTGLGIEPMPALDVSLKEFLDAR